MKVAYIRVSTTDQNLDRQERMMRDLGVDKVFAEKLSGRSADRPELQAMLAYVREADTVIVESISRLARSTRDLLNIVEILKSKGVVFISLKEQMDTSTPQGKFMLTVFSGLAELQRESILESQREGIEAAKAKGKRLGRPRTEYPPRWEEIYGLWRDEKITAVAAMLQLGLRRTTFYKLVKDTQQSA
jgi:DNA invertase Pin-like site-specific DNA recombinase